MATKFNTARRQRKHLTLLPYPDFPLSPHLPTKRWYKKIHGTRRYFGKLDDPHAALTKFQEQRDDLYAGREPRGDRKGLELRELVNRFLTAKQRKVDTSELTPGTFGEYYRASAQLIDAMGARRLVDDLEPDDFEKFRAKLAGPLGLAELGKRIQVARSIFKYGFESGMMDRPVRLGPEFRRPSAKAMKRAMRERPSKMYEAVEVRTMLKAANPIMRAMIYLGINASWGNTDLSEAPASACDLHNGVAEFPRPKTGEKRRVILWPETVKAIGAALKARPTPRAGTDAGQLFITRHGQRYVRFYRPDLSSRGVICDSVSQEFSKLLKSLKLKRPGVGFYGLRHTFRTIADEVRDRPAVDLIMGHEDLGDMASRYRERIDNDRLRAVSDHVRAWLMVEPSKTKKGKKHRK